MTTLLYNIKIINNFIVNMLDRTLNLDNLLKKKSFFLFGPRATGKSTLLRRTFADRYLIIDLLRSDLYFRLTESPSLLGSMVEAAKDKSIVIIDEVQKIPILLNEVHRLIEETDTKFLLTGSSARKLKRLDVNLLAGRAWQTELFPLTTSELKNFDLARYLSYGGLPSVYLSEEPAEELNAYVSTYLKDEIQAEALVRKIPSFSRFLQTSALANSTMLNFTKISSDTGVPVSTVREYYQILEDTFLGFMLPAWTKTIKRKSISTAKFYFFDIGVKNCLSGIRHVERQSNIYGENFEQFIALEIRAYISYNRLRINFNYWRAKNGQEVDFIVDDKIAIEVKASTKITDKHLKNLYALNEENICKTFIVVSHDTIERKKDNIHMIHWESFLDRLWKGDII